MFKEKLADHIGGSLSVSLSKDGIRFTFAPAPEKSAKTEAEAENSADHSHDKEEDGNVRKAKQQLPQKES